MTTLSLAPRLELKVQEDDRRFVPSPNERCRCCGCTEHSPCRILLRRDVEDYYLLARVTGESNGELPCSWFLPGICNAPWCIEKLIKESGGYVSRMGGIKGVRA